jgi:hypothetical protein
MRGVTNLPWKHRLRVVVQRISVMLDVDARLAKREMPVDAYNKTTARSAVSEMRGVDVRGLVRNMFVAPDVNGFVHRGLGQVTFVAKHDALKDANGIHRCVRSPVAGRLFLCRLYRGVERG